MDKKFIISKKSNHFFFIQNLAEWHFSCRKGYNKVWLEETGPLNKKEQEAIVNLREMLKKHDFKSLNSRKAYNIFDYLIRFKDIKEEIKTVTKSDITAYLNTMDVFKDRFERIWSEEGIKLKRNGKLIEEKLLATEEKVVNDLTTLFANLDLKEEVKIILLLSTGERGGGGGANNGPNTITLECSSTKKEYLNESMFIIWHEITHTMMRGYTSELKKILDGDKNIKVVAEKAKINTDVYINELFINSLFTNMSYLTCRHFKTESCTALQNAIKNNNTEWLCRNGGFFTNYLIYLNGNLFKERLEKKEKITPEEMASIMIKNLTIVESYCN